MSDIAVFGTGDCYHRYIGFIKEKENVNCILDNNSTLWGKRMDGTMIVAPEKLVEYEFEYIVLLITSTTAGKIKKQLMELNIQEDKILLYDEYLGIYRADEYKVYYPHDKREVIVIGSHLAYDGASVALYHAALALVNKNYTVTIAVPCANEKFINELKGMRIEIVIYPSIMQPGDKVLDWVKQFDYIICNDEYMVNCVKKLNDKNHVVWWLHSPSELYAGLVECYGKINPCEIRNVDIYAVSGVARKNFIKFFGKTKINLLSYGIPDRGRKELNRKKSNKVIFSVIAGVCKLKAQDIFLEAAKKLNASYAEKVEYWLIGHCGEDSFSALIRNMAAEMPNVRIKGVLTRKEIEEAFVDIDAVVCPSWEECLPTVIVEGMMHEKIGIVSDNTGLTDYITNGVNGLICKTGDADSLYEKMKFVAENYDKLGEMKSLSRKTYEKNFSLEVFGDNLEKIILRK